MSLNQAKLEQFLERFTNDLGAAMSATLVVVGDRRPLQGNGGRGPGHAR